jgi:DNA-binding response OmpR family regulator
MRILLVEDELHIAEALVIILQKTNIQLTMFQTVKMG